MGALDWLFILVLIAAIAIGYWRGFFKQLGAVAGILLGIIVCRIWADDVARFLTPANADHNEAYITMVIAYVLLFFVVYLASQAIFMFFKNVVSALKLSILDRLGGIAFTIIEYFFILSLLLNLWQAVSSDKSITRYSRIDHGRAAVVVLDFAPTVIGTETAQTLFKAIP